MSFFDDLLSKLTPSPGVETVLSAIPQLVGAYESARGRPIGAPLSMLGQFGDINAKNRQQQGNVDALTKLAQGFTPQNAPITAGQFQQLQPNLSGMTPDLATKELENIQGMGQAEETAQVKDPGQLKFTKDGKVYEYFPQEKDPKKRIVEHPEMEGGGGTGKPPSSVWAAFASGDPKRIQQAKDFMALQNAGRVSLLNTELPMRESSALDAYSRKKDIDAQKIGLKPAASQGLVPIDADGTPMAGGSIADAQANGALAKADVAPYQEADKAIKGIDRLTQQAVDLNGKAPALFPKAPNLMTASGDISVPILKRLAPQLYDPMQTSIALLADQVAKSQIGGRAQQSAMQLQQYLRNPHSTLTSMLETLSKVKDAMEDEKRARLARGKNQTDQSWNRLMMQINGTPMAPDGTPVASPTSTAPTVPLKGSF